MVIAVKAIACELPAQLGLPLSRLQVPDIQAEVINRGLVASISGSTIWQWLSEDAIRPWRHRSWIFPRDPDFSTKAGRVLDLYARKFEGERLGPGEYVISSDEKTSLQARLRCHPTASAGPRRPLRVEHEYTRGGAWAYLAAWDVHRAKLFVRLEPTTGIELFGRLVDQVMAVEPDRSADRAPVGGRQMAARIAARPPRTGSRWRTRNAVMADPSVHRSWAGTRSRPASSPLQRKESYACRSSLLLSLADLAASILAFEAGYQEEPRLLSNGSSPARYPRRSSEPAIRPTRGPEHVIDFLAEALRGFTNYFGFAVAKQDFGSLEWYALQRFRRWMQRVHGGMSWRDLARRFVRKGTFVVDGVVLFLPRSVPVERYRYRGAQIFNLWQRPRASPAP